MKTIPFKEIAIFLLIGLLFINILLIFINKNDPMPPIASFIGQNAVLANGYNFDTAKPIVVDPITSITLSACHKTKINRSGNKSGYKVNVPTQDNSSEFIGVNDFNLDCGTEIVNPAPFLNEALKNSQNVIKGTIKKDGKEIPARFLISVTALYEGSNCVTYFSGGEQYESCESVKSQCRSVLSTYTSFPDPYRTNVINTCKGFRFWR